MSAGVMVFQEVNKTFDHVGGVMDA